MPFDNLPDLIKGVVSGVTAIGGIGYALYRFRLITFGRNPKQSLLDRRQPCSMHRETVNLLHAVKETQVSNVLKHDQHKLDLATGKAEFLVIRGKLSQLEIGVAVLLDRTGGRPPGFKQNEKPE